MAKQLNAKVVLDGSTTGGFQSLSGQVDELGNKIAQMGEQVVELSQHLYEFGSESVDTYKNYETYMLQAKAAMSQNYESAAALERDYKNMQAAAQQWAGSTIFHTDDVAKAMAEAAHAGWDYSEMMQGIPQAMLLAQAGGLDLSSGLDFLVKVLEGTGTEFADSGKLVDQWTMAANSSATTISELGEAMERMGATTRFASSTEELLTMLAVLANTGTTGANAGTLLRNTMLRIVAPTKAARDAMESLGVTSDEITEAVGNDTEALAEANEILAKSGFSAYNEQTGKLKDYLTIFRELNKATSGMTEETRNKVLATIFPTRSITGAIALLQAAAEDYDGLLEKIAGSEGYAEEVSGIQLSGLFGSEELFLSKWEEFKRKVGETLAEPLENAYGFAGGIIDKLNSIDPTTLSSLVSGLTTIAGLGGALMVAGIAMKMFSGLGVAGVAALLLAGGLGAAVTYLREMREIDFKSAFGDMELDVGTLNEYVSSVTTKFGEEKAAVDQYKDSIRQAQESYNNLIVNFGESLTSKVLTNGKLNHNEYTNLTTLGRQIVNSVKVGINAAKDKNMTLSKLLFGDAETSKEEAAGTNAEQWFDLYYSSLSEEAEQIGQNIHERLTKGLNGEITAEDRAAIQREIARLNAIQAEIAAGVRDAEAYAQMQAATRVSWDSAESFLNQNAEKQAAALAAIDEQYDAYIGSARAAYEYAKKHGNKWITTDENGNVKEVDINTNPDAWVNFETWTNRERETAKKEEAARYGQTAAAVVDALARDSNFGEAWGLLYSSYLSQMNLANQEDFLKAFGGMDTTKLESLRQQFSEMLLRSGDLQSLLNPYVEAGDATAYAMMAALQGASVDSATNQAYSLISMIGQYIQDTYGMNDTMRNLYNQGAEVRSWNGVDQLTTEIGGENGIDVVANISGDATDLQAKIEDADGQLLIEKVIGDADELKALIESFNGKTVTLTLKGKGLFGAQQNEYAEGGRATEASIFGEAGAEWAIPEEHTPRTASLFDEARKASGFTWGELIAANGGLNSGGGGVNVNIGSYSPVINAQDASGVAAELEKDKKRLSQIVKEAVMKALGDQRMMDSVTVYA